MVSHFVINDKYHVRVQPSTQAYQITKMYFGGPRRKCVNIDIYEHSDKGYMSALGYDKKCNGGEDLARGEGTRDLVKAALAFCYQQYSKLEGVTLKDASKIVCKNGETIPLYFLSIAVNGGTWYERHFKAKFEHKEQRALYRRFKKSLANDIVCDIPELKGTVLEGVYKNCREARFTYMQFFQAVLEWGKGDCSPFTINNWLERTLARHPQCPKFKEAYWLIKRSSVGCEVSIRQLRKGGASKKKREKREKRDIVLKHMYEL